MCRDTHKTLFGVFLSFFPVSCQTSVLTEPSLSSFPCVGAQSPAVVINEPLGPIIMVLASVYITWAKDAIQLVREKNILNGKVDLIP